MSKAPTNWVPYARKKKTNRTKAYAKKAAGSGKKKAKSASSSDYAIGKGIGAAIGAALGASFGGPQGGIAGGSLGSAIGGGAHSLFKSVTGFGDYTISQNTLFSAAGPAMFNKSNRKFRVSNREYIQDIISGGINAFNVESFNINPADPETFPWLCEIAEQFEQYKINGLLFEFRSNSADALNSTNTALGQVIGATQLNVTAPEFTNKQAMENYMFGSSVRPSANMICPLECDPKLTPFGPWFNTRLGGSITGTDPRLFDMGRFSIATNGMQAANVNVGELWVTYDIEFAVPRMSNPDFTIHWQLGGDAGTVIAADLFSNAEVTSSSDTIDITLGVNTITLPNWYSGNIQVTYFVAGTVAAACVDPTMVATLGASDLNLFNLDTENDRKNTYAAGTVAFENTGFFKCVNGGLITFSAATLPTGVVIGDLIISTIPSTLLN